MLIPKFLSRTVAVLSTVLPAFIAKAAFAQGTTPTTPAKSGPATLEKLRGLGSSVYGGTEDQLNRRGDLLGIIGYLIKILLGILGVVFVILMVYAGFIWMTARGDEKMVTKAKDTIQRAIIGLIITISAYAITTFIFSRIFTAS